MSKKETFEQVVTATNLLCDELGVKDKVRSGLMAIYETHLAPKAAGQAVDLDSVTEKDESGTIIKIKCQLSGVLLPATADFFYEEKSGKGILGLDGKNLRRLSKAAEKARKDHEKLLRTSDKALKEDLFAGKITAEDYQTTYKKLQEAGPDFSKVGAEPAEPTEPANA